MSFKDYIDEWLTGEVKKLNYSLPRRTVELLKLLEMEEPCVETIGGGLHYFAKDELLKIRSALPQEIASKVKLPLIFLKRSEYGEGAYVLRGSEDEVKVYEQLLGITLSLKKGSEVVSYKPEVLEFMRRFPTVGVIGFL